MATTFNNKEEFKQFVIENKPREIWMDSFSTEVPYIKVSHYSSHILSGQYTNQIFLTAYLSKIGEYFEEGMYVK